jgi:hypothetical protein
MFLHEGMTVAGGRYVVLTNLGVGMGAAHLVEDGVLGRRCVIKEVLTHDATSESQFMHEAQLLAKLKHENLPMVHDYFLDGGRPYLVMEYVEGRTLDRLGAEREVPFFYGDVYRWTVDLLAALDYLHTQEPPIIHRDIKPSNVCITPRNRAILLDFGIARSLDETRTRTALQALTPGYAPIEQYTEDMLRNMPSVRRCVEALRAEGIRTGSYTDVYGLGATLYYALTLLTPPDACLRVLGEELQHVRQLNPDVPRFLAATVMKALSIEPDDRFQSAAEMSRFMMLNERIEFAGEVLAPGPVFTYTMGPDDGRRAWVRIDMGLARFLQGLDWGKGKKMHGGGLVAYKVETQGEDRLVNFRLREGIQLQKLHSLLLRGEFWPNKGPDKRLGTEAQPRGVNLMLPNFCMGRRPTSKKVWLLALGDQGLEFRDTDEEYTG